MSSPVPHIQVNEDGADSCLWLESNPDGAGEDTKDVKEEFKSCIHETLSTVCRVASLKKKKNDSNNKPDVTTK
ncbi:hypothetical protein GCK32_021986 [Trichostrongylus colubriformis]|uniref:Uncharacterized protein n=1 Tax=Trichostrongylus colubriformis TaxID=6319 RepID=A0AAN8F215_TRICO